MRKFAGCRVSKTARTILTGNSPAVESDAKYGDRMEMLDDATEAYLLKSVADAIELRLPIPPQAIATLDKFIVNGWILKRGDGIDRGF